MNNYERPVVVLGDHHYHIERHWGQLPATFKFNLISQLAIDSKDFVYVIQRSDPPVVVFQPTGRLHSTWGNGSISDAHGIFISSKDQVFVVDRDAHQILIFTTEGILKQTIGHRHMPSFQAPFNHPTSTAVGANGDVYIADGYGNSTIHRFSAKGKLIKTWGRPGTGPGEFSTPHAVWVDKSKRVLVADRENNRVQIFDPEGTCLDEWGDFYHPMDIYEDKQGLIYVTDQTPRLSVMSSEGDLIGRCRPVLNTPHGVWGNTRGDLFLAEMAPTSITKLKLLN